jgi:hypothetical protein
MRQRSTCTAWIVAASLRHLVSLGSFGPKVEDVMQVDVGATHFLIKTLPRVASEMALRVLAYNLTRTMNIMGIQRLMAAIGA